MFTNSTLKQSEEAILRWLRGSYFVAQAQLIAQHIIWRGAANCATQRSSGKIRCTWLQFIMAINFGQTVSWRSPNMFSYDFPVSLQVADCVLRDGAIDYDECAHTEEHKPKLIVCSRSAYPRIIDSNASAKFQSLGARMSDIRIFDQLPRVPPRRFPSDYVRPRHIYSSRPRGG